VARGEVRRRSGQLRIAGPELDDLAHQAAADAVVGVTTKVAQFRGESRFTTWACKFAIFEVSTKIGRHFWQKPTVSMDDQDWDRLPDRFGLDPGRVAEWRDVIAALHRAVDDELTDRQRRIFVAIVLNGTPLDALVIELGSSRTPSTRPSSTPDVSCGPRWPLTGIWMTTLRGRHEQLGITRAVLEDRPGRCRLCRDVRAARPLRGT
jgi:DNA-directed RNA polymerase specialized sigma24 family protein